MKIEQRALKGLVPYARNAKLHNDEQVNALAESIKRFGFNNPVLIDAKGVIVAGHGRVLAAAKLKLKTVPVYRLGHLSRAEVKAYRVADNRLAETGGGWDMEMLRLELGGIDLDLLPLTGFTLDDMNPAAGYTDPDEVPPPPKVATTRRGDKWLCADHRILCGDATAVDDVRSVISSAPMNLMVTDPPYGVNYSPEWRDEMGIDWVGQVQRRSTHPDVKPLKSRSLGKVANDDRADWREAWALFPGNIVYVWHAGMNTGIFQASLIASDFLPRAHIIWSKQHFVFSRGDYHWQHEPCWYAVRKGKRGDWTGDRKQTTIWEIANASAFHGDKEDHRTGHGTQKPVECMARPMRNNSRPGDAIYDPFLGSGTTMIAAEMERRRCIGIDIDPIYVDVAVLRWQAFTGKEATLEGDGRTFAEIAAERAKKKRRAKPGASPKKIAAKKRSTASAIPSPSPSGV